MSPEQSVSSRVAATNDTYSWGAILFNMINEEGLEPWAGMDAHDIAKTISGCLAKLDRKRERIRNGEEKDDNCDDHNDNGNDDNDDDYRNIRDHPEIVEDEGLMSQLIPRDGCPAFLLDLCKRCLSVDYTKRPKSGAELVKRLKKGVANLLAANPEGAAAIVGDVTYMELSATGDGAGAGSGGDLQQQFSGTQYVENTECIEGGGYD